MSVELKRINIFDTDPKSVVIGHQANCCAKMGRGLAEAIALRYPEAASADMAYHWPSKLGEANPDKLGHFSFANESTDGRWIVNIYGQLRYGYPENGPYTDYTALELAFINTKIWMTKNLGDEHSEFPRILALPYRMGANRAGGDWNIVKSSIHAIFDKAAVDVWICKPI